MKAYIRKGLSILLSVLMIAVCIPTMAYAADSSISAGNVDIDLKASTDVTVPFTISGNTGVGGVSMMAPIPDGWSIKGIKNRNGSERSIYYIKVDDEWELIATPVVNPADGSFVVSTTESNLTTDGVLFWVTYSVPSTEINGQHELTPVVKYINTVENTSVNIAGSFKINSGTVTVTGGTDKLMEANTTISGIETSYEYTGSEIKPKLTVSYNNRTLTEGTDYTVLYEDNTNIGTATVTVTGIDSYKGSVKRTFEITKKAAKINIQTTSHTKNYGDAAFPLGASVNSGAELSYVSDKPDVASVDENGTVTIVNAGTANITVSAPETANYQKPADKKITVTVRKADQTITGPNNLNLTYGDESFDIGVGLNPAETGATLSYTSSNSSVVNVESSGNVVINGAGSAIITVTASEVSGKYNSATKKISVNVEKKELKISGITAKSKAYDGTTSAELVYPSSINGIKFGDKVIVTAKGTFTDANAGTNKTVNITDIKLDSVSDKNYKIAASGNQTTTKAVIDKAEYKETVSADVTVPADKEMKGRTLDISAFRLPAGFVDAEITGVTLSSNNDNVISGTPTVSASGKSVIYNSESYIDFKGCNY